MTSDTTANNISHFFFYVYLFIWNVDILLKNYFVCTS